MEALVEPRAQAFKTEQPRTGGGQLDCQRHAVQPTTDLRNRRHLAAVNCRRGSAARARATKSSTAAAGASRCRYRQASQPIDLFLGDVKGFLSSHQDAQRRDAAQQRPSAFSGRVQQVFAVVEHQQSGMLPQQGNHRFEHRSVITDTYAKCPGNRSGNQRAVAQRSQLDPPDTVGKPFLLCVCHSQRKPRLANTAGTDDRYLRVSAQQVADGARVIIATVEQLVVGDRLVGIADAADVTGGGLAGRIESCAEESNSAMKR